MKQIIFITLLLFLISCENFKNNKDIPLEEIGCHQKTSITLEDSTSYVFSLGQWEQDTIKYYIDLESAHKQAKRFEKSIVDSWCEYQSYLPNKVIERVFEKNKSNIYSEVSDTIYIYKNKHRINVGGIRGGVLGIAEFPPFDKYGKQRIFQRYDRVDFLNPNLDFTAIVMHETGHSLGLRHSQMKGSVMSPYYSNHSSLKEDDIIALKTKYYDGNEAFVLNSTTFIWINKYDDRYYSKNFKYSEFFSKCETSQWRDSHYMRKDILDAIQIIRDYIGAPVNIISSYRHKDCNEEVGGVAQSQHQRCAALDFKVDPISHKRIKYAFRSRNILYKKLVEIGVTGFGVYNSSLHIDCGKRKDNKIGHWGF